MKCLQEFNAPLERLSGVRTLVFEACDKQEGPRGGYEARLRELVREKAGREVHVMFDYETRFLRNPYYRVDIDDSEVRYAGDENEDEDEEEEDDNDDGGVEEDDDFENEDEQGDMPRDSEDEAILA